MASSRLLFSEKVSYQIFDRVLNTPLESYRNPWEYIEYSRDLLKKELRQLRFSYANYNYIVNLFRYLGFYLICALLLSVKNTHIKCEV